MPPKSKAKITDFFKGSKRPKDDSSDSEDEYIKPSKAAKKDSGASSSRGYDSSSEVEFNFKIVSWNVNGAKAWMKCNPSAFVSREQPDIICLQEIKCEEDKFPPGAMFKGYHVYLNSADQKGYAGTGILSKTEPMEVKYGIGKKEHDNEGRVITAEYKKFYLVTAYVPNSGRGLPRLGYRQDWDKDFMSYLKRLDKKKPIILCGDLNVAHQEIDLTNPRSNKRTAGFTQEERDGFTKLLSQGFVDTFREFNPEKKNVYSFWTYMRNARAKNVGWRLDYFVVSDRFLNKVSDSLIKTRVMGSDHCPISLLLSI